MKASEIKLQQFFSLPNTQFVIPVYQRHYDWKKEQCFQLLDDIISVGQYPADAGATHFIGSMVQIHESVYAASDINPLSIIDGQQRITTLMLIYLALYRHAISKQQFEFAEKIREECLINKFAPKNTSKLKLLAHPDNQAVLEYLLRNDPIEDYPEYSYLLENFKLIQQKILENDVRIIWNGLGRLIFVEIALEREKDNPQKIFESLNSNGLDLSQADLIRNYILMNLNPAEQHEIYHDYWQVIERFAFDQENKQTNVSEFIRDYLILKTGNIPNKDQVYNEFKRYCSQPLFVLSELKVLAPLFYKILNPENEKDSLIRQELGYIKSLDNHVIYPVLLLLYSDFSQKKISRDIFLSLLKLLQSYIFRRFIADLPTNSLNKICLKLAQLLPQLNTDDYVESIQRFLLLQTGNRRFPNNREFYDKLKTKDIYHTQAKNRWYLLHKIENFNNKEQVLIDESITVEHIFPQSPNTSWLKHLGEEECQIIHHYYLHTLANLTLSGNNGKLGNRFFTEKRDLPNVGYKDSRFWLNKYLSQCDSWDSQQIQKRFEFIFERCIAIWEYPAISTENEHTFLERSYFSDTDY